MLFFLHRLLGFLCGFVPVLPMIALYHGATGKKAVHQDGTTVSHRFMTSCVFCLYIFAVFSVTDIPNVFQLNMDPSVDLIPFNYVRTNTVQYLLNILLFVPLGFFLPMLWQRFRRMHRCFVFGAVLSCFIEVMQLFNYRITDIDDLLMNTAGTVMGYFLYMWGKRWFFTHDAGNRLMHCTGSPLGYVFLVWLSVFFIQPVFSHWLLGLVFRGRVVIG